MRALYASPSEVELRSDWLWRWRDRAEAGALNAETIPIVADAAVVLRDVSAGKAPVVVVVDTVGFGLLSLVDRIKGRHCGHMGTP
jgi:hypothetical protein